jgi:hypothetical protein
MDCRQRLAIVLPKSREVTVAHEPEVSPDSRPKKYMTGFYKEIKGAQK